MLTITLTGEIPAGLTQRIKELTSEFDLVIDDESNKDDGTTIELSSVGPILIVSDEGCTSCEG